MLALDEICVWLSCVLWLLVLWINLPQTEIDHDVADECEN